MRRHSSPENQVGGSKRQVHPTATGKPVARKMSRQPSPSGLVPACARLDLAGSTATERFDKRCSDRVNPPLGHHASRGGRAITEPPAPIRRTPSPTDLSTATPRQVAPKRAQHLRSSSQSFQIQNQLLSAPPIGSDVTPVTVECIQTNRFGPPGHRGRQSQSRATSSLCAHLACPWS